MQRESRYRGRIRNRIEWEALPRRAQEERLAALRALSYMRENPSSSLTESARREGASRDEVLRYVSGGLERRGNRWAVKPADRLYRSMFVNSGGRVVTVDVRGSRKASEVSRYHTAVRRYLETGNEDQLRRFIGKNVAGVEYEADPDVLDEMARRGQLTIESIYQVVA